MPRVWKSSRLLNRWGRLRAAIVCPSPGGALTVSANGKEPGTGIVWATLTTGKSADHGNAAGVLRALNAETLEELWNSEANPKRDRLGTLVKFVPTLVVDGARLCAELR